MLSAPLRRASKLPVAPGLQMRGDAVLTGGAGAPGPDPPRHHFARPVQRLEPSRLRLIPEAGRETEAALSSLRESAQGSCPAARAIQACAAVPRSRGRRPRPHTSFCSRRLAIGRMAVPAAADWLSRFVHLPRFRVLEQVRASLPGKARRVPLPLAVACGKQPISGRGRGRGRRPGRALASSLRVPASATFLGLLGSACLSFSGVQWQ